VLGFFYVSWWTAVLFGAGLLCLGTALLIGRRLDGQQRWILAGVGAVFLVAYVAAVIVGPGRLIVVHGDFVLDAHVIVLGDVEYTEGGEGCEESDDLAREIGLSRMRSIGHLWGLFGGPQVVIIPDEDPLGPGPGVPDLFLKFSEACYEEWYPYGQI
jgi:hypothetical protein